MCRQKKAPDSYPAPFFAELLLVGLSVNCVHRAGINTSAAVDTGIGIDNPFVACFTDCVHRAGFIACAAIDALFGNGMSQDSHLLLFDLVGIGVFFS
jgi:hypothetical protein